MKGPDGFLDSGMRRNDDFQSHMYILPVTPAKAGVQTTCGTGFRHAPEWRFSVTHVHTARHPGEGRGPEHLRHWIPACAGM